LSENTCAAAVPTKLAANATPRARAPAHRGNVTTDMTNSVINPACRHARWK
jgi:hypothetical protein